MKLISLILITSLTVIGLFSCADNDNHETNATTEQSGKENATVNDLMSSDRKIIKTADLKARVTNVYQATHLLERSVTDMKGLITESILENQVTQTKITPYKTDSVKQIQSYTSISHLTLRIPVAMIDTFMTTIAESAAFIDHRNLKLNDVTLHYISNELKNQGIQEGNMAKAQTLSKQSKDIIQLDKYANDVKESKIDRRIQNLEILDQSNFATIRIDLYQPERIDQVIVPNIDYLMKPAFKDQITSGVLNGWELLKLILIGLSNIWTIVIMVGAVIFIIRSRRPKMKLVK